MGNLTLELAGKPVPLPSDAELAITYKANDIRSFGKHDGAYAETITLPDTHPVKRVLGNSHLLTSGTTTPYELIPAVLKYKENPVLTGNAEHPETEEGFALDLSGNNADLFARIKGLDLSALDLSDLDHTYNQATVTGANTHNQARGYAYPLINYGTWITRYLDPTNQHFTDLYPAVYVSELLTRICAPYTLAGSLLQEDRFKRMVLPFVNEAFVYRESFTAATRALCATTSNVYYGPSTLTVIVFHTKTGSGAANVTGNQFIAPLSGRYNVKAHVKFTTNTVPGTINTIQLLHTSAGGAVTLELHKQDYGDGGLMEYTLDFTTNLIDAGDKLYLAYSPGGGGLVTNDTDVLAGSTFEVVLSNKVTEGGPVHLEVNLPDIKQEELLLFVLNSFDVLIQANPVTGIVRLDLRDDLEDLGPLDWSHKIDFSRKPKTVFALDGYAQSNIFQYAELDYPAPDMLETFELAVANERLEKENVFYEAPFTFTETIPAFNAALLLPYVPTLQQQVVSLGLWRNTVEYSELDYVRHNGRYFRSIINANIGNTPVPSDTPVNWQEVPEDEVLKYQGATPRVLLMETRTGQAAVPVGNGITATNLETQAVFYRSGGFGLGGDDLKTAYHGIAQKMLDKTRLLSVPMRITLNDIATLDFLRPIMLNVPERNVEGVFYLNAINQWNPDRAVCEVELVRVFGLPLSVPEVLPDMHEEFSEEFSEEFA